MARAARSERTKTHVETFRDGRDEMNLVEFPFATLSERAGGRKILEFQVQTYDRVLGKPVVRKLTVTGDAKFGLPTAKDEEVYLALLQLTKLQNNFSEPRVLFTRSELIRLMGWKNRDWSYHRIAKALARLTGVRLFYENAWRDNARKKYRTTAGFGLLDSFELRDGRVRSPDGDESERLSEFRWNSVVFESFEAGYLKKLDYDRVRGLGAVSRRIYRFLDKHFHPPHRTTLVLDLQTFACEHVGMSRSNDAAQLRRGLSKAIKELEEIRFVVPNRRRFQRIEGQRGKWQLTFTLCGYPSPRRERGKMAEAAVEVTARANSSTNQRDRLDQYLDSLSDNDRQAIEAEAMSSASGFLLETLESQGGEGPLAETCRRQIVRAFVKSSMERRKATRGARR